MSQYSHWQTEKICPALAIHGSEMKNSKQVTYFGDIIHESWSIKPNIEKRKSKGYGITSNILAIVNEIPLAQWRTEAGLNHWKIPLEALFLDWKLYS